MTDCVLLQCWHRCRCQSESCNINLERSVCTHILRSWSSLCPMPEYRDGRGRVASMLGLSHLPRRFLAGCVEDASLLKQSDLRVHLPPVTTIFSEFLKLVFVGEGTPLPFQRNSSSSHVHMRSRPPALGKDSCAYAKGDAASAGVEPDVDRHSLVRQPADTAIDTSKIQRSRGCEFAGSRTGVR